MAAGFRESGIGSNNLVGIRISLKLDVPIAKLDPATSQLVPLVSDEFVIDHLDLMMRDRFRENFRRRDVLRRGIARDFFTRKNSQEESEISTFKRFTDEAQSLSATSTAAAVRATTSANGKEDKEARRERKRREGLLRQADCQKEKAAARLLKQQQEQEQQQAASSVESSN
jgi:tRNA wybutosine-synthesizing protein 3